MPPLSPPPSRAPDGLVGRGEGATDQQLRVVAEAKAEGFVGTKRLEEEAGGAYGWRNVLMGWFRYAARPPLSRVSACCSRERGPCAHRSAVFASHCNWIHTHASIFDEITSFAFFLWGTSIVTSVL
jgi:hypothetical protein